jgi:hypothetical protein
LLAAFRTRKDDNHIPDHVSSLYFVSFSRSCFVVKSKNTSYMYIITVNKG